VFIGNVAGLYQSQEGYVNSRGAHHFPLDLSKGTCKIFFHSIFTSWRSKMINYRWMVPKIIHSWQNRSILEHFIIHRTIYDTQNYYRYEQDSGNRQADVHFSKMLTSRFTSLHATFYRIPCKIAFSGFYAENVRWLVTDRT